MSTTVPTVSEFVYRSDRSYVWAVTYTVENVTWSLTIAKFFYDEPSTYQLSLSPLTDCCGTPMTNTPTHRLFPDSECNTYFTVNGRKVAEEAPLSNTFIPPTVDAETVYSGLLNENFKANVALCYDPYLALVLAPLIADTATKVFVGGGEWDEDELVLRVRHTEELF